MAATLTKHDIDLAKEFIFRFEPTGGIIFQFPPKITSDGRKGTWSEPEWRGTEPIAIFSTSGPREIALSTTYIVDGSPGWTAQKIHTQIKAARGYFARIREGDNTRALVCNVKMWEIGGSFSMTCRLTNIGVKYSDTIVGDSKNAYPLRTDLTLDIRIWTKGTGKLDKKEEAVQLLRNLKDGEDPEWY